MAPPPPKRRRTEKDRPDEVTFDFTAREDYLTGFRKRKQQRIKHAQGVAAEKERALKIESRKHIREQRQKDLEEHVKAVNDMLANAGDGNGSEDDEGENRNAEGDAVSEAAEEPGQKEYDRREDEYIDEEKYTTVTVEPMEGSESEADSEVGDEPGGSNGVQSVTAGRDSSTAKDDVATKKRIWTKERPQDSGPKKRKKKFRYETKIERKAGRSKQKARNSAAAKARRESAPSRR